MNIDQNETFDSDDTEALGWAGDDPDDARTRIKDAPTSSHDNVTGDTPVRDLPKAQSSAWPVVYGIFAGFYSLYVVGWALYIFNHPVPHTDLLQAIMTELGEALAIVAPIFWFFAAMVMVEKERKVLRLVWLAIGLVVLMPLPFMLVGVQ